MMLARMQDSPMPMNTTSGRDSETATAPTDELVSWPSVTGAHFMPPSVVFHRPPPTARKYASLGGPFSPDTAIDRPPRSGPMLRHLNEASSCSSGSPDCADCADTRDAGMPSCQPAATSSKAAQKIKVRYLMKRDMRPSHRANDESSI